MGDFFMSGTKEKKLNLPQSLLLLLLIIVSVAVCIRLRSYDRPVCKLDFYLSVL